MSDDIVEVCARAIYHSQYWARPAGLEWSDVQRAGYQKDALAALAALAALEAAGYAVVPVEPSEAMVEDGRAALSQGDAKVQTHARVLWVWAAMLKASKQDAGEAADRQVSA